MTEDRKNFLLWCWVKGSIAYTCKRMDETIGVHYGTTVCCFSMGKASRLMEKHPDTDSFSFHEDA